MHGTSLKAILCLVALAALSGCATFPAPHPARQPDSLPPQPFPGSRAPVALVLSGGAARGLAHVGVLKVLETSGIRPDLIVGSSAGSIVGALYASGLSAGQVEAALGEMSNQVFSDVSLPGLGLLPGALGVLKGEKLRGFVRERLRHELSEDFPIRFAAVATDLRSGETRAFNSGDAALAVHASSAVPGIFSPVGIGGRLFGDGQISSPLPVHAARQLGAKIVIAVDVLYPAQDAAFSTALGVVFQAFTISMNRLRDFERAEADLVIQPMIPPTGSQLGLSSRALLIEVGENAAREAMPRLLEKLRRDR